MELKRFGENRLEILLDESELARWQLCPEKLGEQDPLTKTLLTRFLHEVSGLGAEEGEFLIEAMRDGEQIRFCLTRIEPEKKEQVQVFRFAGSEEMLGGCLRLYRLLGEKTGESSLYRMKDDYYLSVMLREEEMSAARELLLEYGSCALHPKTCSAVLAEHARCLIPKDALPCLSRHFA